MKYTLYILFFFIISFPCLAQYNRPPGTKIYVVTHPQQLHLYMAGDAVQDIYAAKDSSRHLVLIYITSDEQQEKTGAQKRSYDYRTNEAAARSAIEIISNTYEYNRHTQHIWMSDWEADRVTFNNHRILQYKNKNITCYFLRLLASDDNRGELQGLEQLYEGKTSQISVADTSMTYNSWEEILTTVQTIMQTETGDAKYSPWLNTIAEQDNSTPEATLNKYVSLLATEAFTNLPRHGMISYYKNFYPDLLPANMTPEQIVMQAAMMAAYDVTRTCKGEASDWEFTMAGKAGKT
jgi:hypothetical protein